MNYRVSILVLLSCVFCVISCTDSNFSTNNNDSYQKILSDGPNKMRIMQQVSLPVGANFNQANSNYPSGTTFIIESGTHTQQRVLNPKTGNSWIGEDGAVMDGQDSISDAFHGSASNITIENIEIRNYVDNGINFDSGSNISIDDVTVKDTGSGSGEYNGAIRFDFVSDITVTNSHFERVSSAILPSFVTGPIVVEWNTGENIGRNFFQCDQCDGGGIRVRFNTMERVGSYLRSGADDVEDWISVHKTEGLSSDPAEFNYNRAKGHGGSQYGSFIMLGDGGGKYLEAIGNIGVTPGQVGIGIAGGEFITVSDNSMYSEQWNFSNISYYSADYSPGACGNHYITDNKSNWLDSSGNQNNWWHDGKCSPTTYLSGNTVDQGMDEDIWDQWPPYPPSTPLQVSIDGPYYVQTNQYVEFDALVSGGESPYNYQWQIDYGSGSGPWQDVGSNTSFFGNIFYSTGTIYLRVIVTDNNNDDQTSTFHQVTVQ